MLLAVTYEGKEYGWQCSGAWNIPGSASKHGLVANKFKSNMFSLCQPVHACLCFELLDCYLVRCAQKAHKRRSAVSTCIVSIAGQALCSDVASIIHPEKRGFSLSFCILYYSPHHGVQIAVGLRHTALPVRSCKERIWHATECTGRPGLRRPPATCGYAMGKWVQCRTGKNFCEGNKHLKKCGCCRQLAEILVYFSRSAHIHFRYVLCFCVFLCFWCTESNGREQSTI